MSNTIHPDLATLWFAPAVRPSETAHRKNRKDSLNSGSCPYYSVTAQKLSENPVFRRPFCVSHFGIQQDAGGCGDGDEGEGKQPFGQGNQAGGIGTTAVFLRQIADDDDEQEAE